VQKIFSPEWNHLSAVKATTVVAETRERHTKNDQPAAMTTRSIKQQRVRASGPPALQHRPSRRSADRSWRANGSRFQLRRPPWPEGWCQHPHDRAKVDQDDRDGSRTSRAAGGGRAVMSEGARRPTRLRGVGPLRYLIRRHAGASVDRDRRSAGAEADASSHGLHVSGAIFDIAAGRPRDKEPRSSRRVMQTPPARGSGWPTKRARRPALPLMVPPGSRPWR
jgi:hypothetical protein